MDLVKLGSSLLGVLSILVFVMLVSGVFRDNNVMGSVYATLKPRIKSKRGLIAALSLILGVLPIPGRISFTCGILDSLQNKKKNNQKMGVIAHLASHHYYLWSPVEKSVIIVTGVLGISYLTFMSYMWIPALLMALFSIVYIFSFVGEDEIELVELDEPLNNNITLLVGFFLSLLLSILFTKYMPIILFTYLGALALFVKTKDSWYKYIDVNVLALAAGAVTLGFVMGNYEAYLKTYINQVGSNHIAPLVILSFFLSFLLGSSAKFAAICGMIVKAVGIKFLPLFYLVEFAGYLVSPSHSCVAIAKSYFKTPVGMFVVPLIAISILMIAYGVIVALLPG